MSSSFRGPAIVLVAFFVLAGCGGAGTTSAVSLGAMTGREHNVSRSYADLLYASGITEVAILTYPGGENVGSISGIVPAGICTDASNGNVWIVTEEYKGFYAYEFSHGGTTPIAKVKVPDALMVLECAVDPSTHDLAVTNWGGELHSYIFVYPGGTGNPNAYSPPFPPQSVVYDNEGNLFTTGESESDPFQFAELPKGSSTFTNIHLDRPAAGPGGLAWDGKYVVVGCGDQGGGQKFQRICRVRIEGSRGRVVSTRVFKGLAKRNFFWLQGDTIIAAREHGRIGDAFWRYPQGGEPYRTGVGSFNAYYVAVSVAASGSHVRK
jgi:hypothetical protein